MTPTRPLGISLRVAIALSVAVATIEAKPAAAENAPAAPGVEPTTSDEPAEEGPMPVAPAVEEAPAVEVTSGSHASSITSSARGAALDWLVMPSGFDLGGNLRFAMSPEGALSDRPLRFSDLGLLDLHGRVGLGRGFELATNTTLAIKHPSDANENVWQGSSLALKWQPGMPGTSDPNQARPEREQDKKRGSRYVLGLSGGAGPMLDKLGTWAGGGASIGTRKRLIGGGEGGVQFEGALGGGGTFLLPRNQELTALAEAQLDLGVLAHMGRRGSHGGGGAVWLSTSFALPVWHRGNDPVSEMPLDPQPRLSFAVGTMVTMKNKWDLVLELRATDRGDLEFPRTRLPILDGGFDLSQVLFGVAYHGEFPRAKDDKGPLIQIPSS